LSVPLLANGTEHAEALHQPWNVAITGTSRAVAIGAGLVLLLDPTAAVRTGVHALDTRARLSRPDTDTGQFPAVKVRRGETVVDLNRPPDRKVQTVVLGGKMGGKTGLLLAMFLCYALGREVPELTEQPNIVLIFPRSQSPFP
jgi:hypothetical protein